MGPEGTKTAVMGIDLALTSCAVTLALPDLPIHVQVIKSKPAQGVRGRVLRYRSIVEPIRELCIQHRPELVLIEGYSFASPQMPQVGHHDRAELRGLLLHRIIEHCGDILEPAPTTLKKFACGRGNAKKAEVVSEVSRRYGRVFKTDDEADSWALVMMALCLSGQSNPETRAQREVIASLSAKRAELAA